LCFFFQAEDGIRDPLVTGVQTCALPICRAILANLIGSPFGGTVYPINPTRDSVLGVKAYPNIAAVPAKVDLAVIMTPAATIPGRSEERRVGKERAVRRAP